jgi:hypothetical protein
MDNNTRKFLFLFICIPLRFLLTYLSKELEGKYKKLLGILFGVIGISFLVLYFFNLRIDAPEGGGNTWWKNFRLIHGVLYLSAFVYSIKDSKNMWIPILIDTIFGLTLFLINRIL